MSKLDEVIGKIEKRYERESSIKESREERIAEVTIAMEKLYPLIKDNIKKNRNSNKYAFDIFRDEYFNYFDYDYITINDLKSIAKYYRIFKFDGVALNYTVVGLVVIMMFVINILINEFLGVLLFDQPIGFFEVVSVIITVVLITYLILSNFIENFCKRIEYCVIKK